MERMKSHMTGGQYSVARTCPERSRRSPRRRLLTFFRDRPRNENRNRPKSNLRPNRSNAAVVTEAAIARARAPAPHCPFVSAFSADHDHGRDRRDDCAATPSIASVARGPICESRDCRDDFRRPIDGSRRSRGYPTGDSRCSRDRTRDNVASASSRDGRYEKAAASNNELRYRYPLGMIYLLQSRASETWLLETTAGLPMAECRFLQSVLTTSRAQSSGAGSVGVFSAGARGRRDAFVSRSRSCGENSVLKRSER